MQAYKFNIDIPANHRYEFTFPESIPVGEAEIIVLSRQKTQEIPGSSAFEAMMAWQQSLPRYSHSAREVEARVREERDAWGE
jgi:hypothetical protein